ncbi:hypothetical protein GCM10009858_05620 [Terrabacter carboxydivorans]|uniref:Uncharacterized protein n=1 Tax=Terrabacter carboxydivorans TaxID=619730 RepID=A0ABP5Y000_9MICO
MRAGVVAQHHDNVTDVEPGVAVSVDTDGSTAPEVEVWLGVEVWVELEVAGAVELDVEGTEVVGGVVEVGGAVAGEGVAVLVVLLVAVLAVGARVRSAAEAAGPATRVAAVRASARTRDERPARAMMVRRNHDFPCRLAAGAVPAAVIVTSARRRAEVIGPTVRRREARHPTAPPGTRRAPRPGSAGAGDGRRAGHEAGLE